MRLTSELTVDAPLEQAWAAVLELGGPVRVQLGTEYAGAARLDDVDEDELTAGFHAHGRETTGHGLAAATIAARLSEADGGTRIAVDAELRLTGDARPDGEALQTTADELLARVAAQLQGPDPSRVPELTQSAPVALRGPDLFVAVAERALIVVAGVALGLALGRALWRGR